MPVHFCDPWSERQKDRATETLQKQKGGDRDRRQCWLPISSWPKCLFSSRILGGLKKHFAFALLLKLLAMPMLTFFPAVITCSSPPQITNGKHDGEGIEKFVYNSTVTYSCDSGFQLAGKASIRCTSTDKTSGAWSGAAPECRGAFIGV